MNYLAHIYLSFNDDQIKIGNFISDFIHGSKYENFPKSIQKGIQLHRKIDSYTDLHPIVRHSKRRLHKRYRHYDGVIIDIFMDHFLAKNWNLFSKIPLIKYESDFIILLEQNKEYLPDKVIKIIPYLKEQKWFSSYATINGISKTLIGVNKRTKGISKMDLAIQDLQDKYTEFESDFFIFFKDLQNYVNSLKDKI
jgi:acyl carrier protein phosphodiesterase